MDFKSSVDLTLFERLRADWEFIQADLIAEVDKDFVVFEERVFKTELFARYLSRYQIAWLRISLQSGIPSQSKRLCRSLSNTLENIFNEIRSGMRSLTIADIKEVLRIEIRKSILHSRHVHLGTNEFSEESVQESLKHQRNRKENLKSTLQQNLKEYESRIDQTLEAILSGKEIELHRDSVDYKQLRRNFVRIHNLRLKWIEDLLENKGRKDSDFEAEAETLLGIEFYGRNDGEVLQQIWRESLIFDELWTSIQKTVFR